MYKKLLLTAFAILLCNILFSQDQWDWNDTPARQDRSYSIAIGPKAGMGRAIVTNLLGSYGFQDGTAYQIGVIANAHFGHRYPQSLGGTGRIGVDAEILYGRRNIIAKNTKEDNLRIHCLEIPILAEIYPIPSLAIEVGPTLVSIMKCSSKQLQFKGKDDVSSEYLTFETKQISGMDLMLTFGINYKLPMGLTFDARYNLGCSALDVHLKSKISSPMVSISYLFSLVN